MLKVPRRNVAELCRIEYDNARVCMMCTAVPCVGARTGMDTDQSSLDSGPCRAVARAPAWLRPPGSPPRASGARHGKPELPRLVLLELLSRRG